MPPLAWLAREVSGLTIAGHGYRRQEVFWHPACTPFGSAFRKPERLEICGALAARRRFARIAKLESDNSGQWRDLRHVAVPGKAPGVPNEAANAPACSPAPRFPGTPNCA